MKLLQRDANKIWIGLNKVGEDVESILSLFVLLCCNINHDCLIEELKSVLILLYIN